MNFLTEIKDLSFFYNATGKSFITYLEDGELKHYFFQSLKHGMKMYQKLWEMSHEYN